MEINNYSAIERNNDFNNTKSNIIPSSQLNNYFESYGSSELTDSYRILSTPSSFAKETLLYIQEVGKLKSLKSHTSRRNSLDSFLFVIVLSGSGIFTYEGKTYSVKPGDLVFIDCKNSYSHQSSETNPWELKWVHFNGLLMDRYYQYFCKKTHSIIIYSENSTAFITILDQLMEFSKYKLGDYEILVSHLLNTIITKILTIKGVHNKIDESTSVVKMNKIKNFIDENFQKKISLDTVAEQFYISKYHMCREFKKSYGITIVKYIITKRITHAKGLLRFSDMQIEEIGQMSGIEDNSYFNKVFQKVEGIKPSEYRKKWRGI